MVTERCLPLFHSVGVQVRAADCARVLNRLRQLGWTPGYSSVGIGQADVDVEELVRLREGREREARREEEYARLKREEEARRTREEEELRVRKENAALKAKQLEMARALAHV